MGVKVAALLLVLMTEVSMQPTTVNSLQVNETVSHPQKLKDVEATQLWKTRERSWGKVIEHVSDGSRSNGVTRFSGGRGGSLSEPLQSSAGTKKSDRGNSGATNYKFAMQSSHTYNNSVSDNMEHLLLDVPMGDAPHAGAASASKHVGILSGPSETGETATSNMSLASSENPLVPVQQTMTPKKGYPYIDLAASPNVSALLGKTAYLSCRVKNLGDKTVSWVRHRDIHLLTVGRYTYTTDQRFRAILQPSTDEYTLMIKYPQHRDSGIYECQVSTTPHLSHYVHLNVVEPVTEVIGGPELFIDRGSTINLTCTVKFSPEPPSYIIWNHNDAIISYNSPRGGVSVLTEKGDTTTSYLLIQQAKPTDSGRYSCNPSNAVPHSILVHVLNGELPAAMHTGGQNQQKPKLSSILYLFISTILVCITPYF